MKINFNLIQNEGNMDTLVSPIELFGVLPNKEKKYDYLRDVQSEVLKKWYDLRGNKDNIIKMNTGSGKTVIGLLILKSCLNEGIGPAIYVLPDNYLVSQVLLEADNLGLKATDDAEDFNFKRGKAILITSIHKLINGKSVFGMRNRNNIKIGSIVIDDVHACVNTTESQFTINIKRDDEKYNKILSLFESDLQEQSMIGVREIFDGLPNAMLQIPYWSWQNKQTQLIELLHESREDDDIMFSWPLLKDTLIHCECCISSEVIEISPKCIPIDKISSYIEATRRIFMSATLNDDSPLIANFDIDNEVISEVIAPNNANDIGDRIILVPKLANSEIEDADIAEKLKELSLEYNVAVIVPSNKRAHCWSEIADEIYRSGNIENGVEELNSRHVGLVVFVNRYDGIDLPEDACRILVIDNMPDVRRMVDKVEDSVLRGSNRLLNQQIQKIEQGMGRGVRSSSDHCVIVLMGNSLLDVLYVNGAFNLFGSATKKQMNLSEKISEQVKGGNIDEIFELADYCLKRDDDWIAASKSALVHTNYSKELHIDERVLINRLAYKKARMKMTREAAKDIFDYANTVKGDLQKGWLKQLAAAYINIYDPVEAQNVQLAAKKLNPYVLNPKEGIQFEKKLVKYHGQGRKFIDTIDSLRLDENKFILKIDNIIERLIFEPDTASKFEQALMDIAFYIGFSARRPENEVGKGPDVLWQTSDTDFIVIECKNGAITDLINKKDCNQLNGSIVWFNRLFIKNGCNVKPLMIHKSNLFEHASSPDANIKIINEIGLKSFKDAVYGFSRAVVSEGNFKDAGKIMQLLKHYGLDKDSIIMKYTSDFKVKNAN